MENASRKKEYGFTFIDVLLILVVIAAAVGLFFSLRGRKVVTDDHAASVTYQIVVAPLREGFRNLVAVSDTVTDPGTSLALGEVTNVSYAPYSHAGIDRSTGAEVLTPVAGRYTMTVTVKASAALTASGYTVNGRALALGETIPFRVPDFEGEGVCVTVTAAG